MRLLVNEETRDRIGNRWANKLRFYEVPILTAPKDGLPSDLGRWPTAEILKDYKPNLPKWMKR